jgi:hypothetical protein
VAAIVIVPEPEILLRVTKHPLFEELGAGKVIVYGGVPATKYTCNGLLGNVKVPDIVVGEID